MEKEIMFIQENRKELFKELYELAYTCGMPLKNHLDISIKKGLMLADIYNANKEIVLFGVLLMDIKLGEAMKNNKINEHTKMSSDFAKEFLEKSDFSDLEIDKIINCVEAHHGKIPYICIEAEICANADCYRFIHPVGVFTYAFTLAKRTDNYIERIKNLEYKLNEKYEILSLPKAKEELKEYYEMYLKQFDEILNYMDLDNDN